MAEKLSHRDRISQQHISLFRNPDTIWLATIAMIGDITMTDGLECPTAGTDGRNVYYAPSFMDKLNDAQLRFIIAHEQYHKGMQHLFVHQYLVDSYTPQFGLKQARMLVNMAQDYVINRDLMAFKAFLLPPDGIVNYCYDKKYDDAAVWDTVKIAEDLASNAKNGGGGGKGNESHDGHDWEGAKKYTSGEGEDTNVAAEELKQEIASAMKEAASLMKRVSGKLPREIGEALTPRADWRNAVQDWFKTRTKGHDIFTYARPNRRHHASGLIIPSSYSECTDRLGIFIDMSGSISAELAKELVSEVQGAINATKPKSVDVMYWDTEVTRHEHYEGEDVYGILNATKPMGGGGTNPSCVVRKIKERGLKIDAAIWLSDGFTGNNWAEDLGSPALWVITHGGCVPAHLPHIRLPQSL